MVSIFDDAVSTTVSRFDSGDGWLLSTSTSSETGMSVNEFPNSPALGVVPKNHRCRRSQQLARGPLGSLLRESSAVFSSVPV